MEEIVLVTVKNFFENLPGSRSIRGCVFFGHPFEKFVTVSWDNTIRVWDLYTNEHFCFKIDIRPNHIIRWDDHIFMVCFSNRDIKCYDIRNVSANNLPVEKRFHMKFSGIKSALQMLKLNDDEFLVATNGQRPNSTWEIISFSKGSTVKTILGMGVGIPTKLVKSRNFSNSIYFNNDATRAHRNLAELYNYKDEKRVITFRLEESGVSERLSRALAIFHKKGEEYLVIAHKFIDIHNVSKLMFRNQFKQPVLSSTPFNLFVSHVSSYSRPNSISDNSIRTPLVRTEPGRTTMSLYVHQNRYILAGSSKGSIFTFFVSESEEEEEEERIPNYGMVRTVTVEKIATAKPYQWMIVGIVPFHDTSSSSLNVVAFSNHKFFSTIKCCGIPNFEVDIKKSQARIDLNERIVYLKDSNETVTVGSIVSVKFGLNRSIDIWRFLL